jgi:hypothetical protein
MDASAFTVAVVPIMEDFGRTATEASYLSTYATEAWTMFLLWFRNGKETQTNYVV